MTFEQTVLATMQKYKILSGSWLKIIALATMLVDHVAHFLLRGQAEWMEPLFVVGSRQVSCYFLMRCVGRMAFPLFAFLIVEGFRHTHHRKAYGRNLLLFALLSEIPWRLLHPAGHNVMFTLLLGFLGMWAIERFKSNRRCLSVVLLGLFAFAFLFRADYGGAGFAFILLLYVLRRHLLLQAIIGGCMLPMKWVPGLAFIPIALYNGRRGFIRGRWAKYLFYAFYPLHLLLLWLVR